MLQFTPSPLQRNPERWFDDMREDLESFWEKPIRFGGLERGEDEPARWSPLVDVHRAGGELIVEVDLPGVGREDLEVRIDEQNLLLEGVRRAEGRPVEESYYRIERPFGPFRRRVALPARVEPGAPVDLRLERGVLRLRIRLAG